MTDITEVKKAVEGMGNAWEDYKKKNDERLAAIEAKKGTAELDQQLARMDKFMDETKSFVDTSKKDADSRKAAEQAREQAEREQKDRLDKIETAIARPGSARDEAKADEASRQYKKAFLDFMRKGEHKLGAEEVKALSAGSDPDGGYTVTPVLSDMIVKTVFETSPMRQIASVETISTKSIEMLVDKDENAATWVGETGAASNTSTAQWAKLLITTHTIAAEPRATQEVLEDSARDLEGWLAQKTSDKFARTENAAFITGDGVAKPRGLLSYTALSDSGSGVSWGNIGYIPTGGSGDWASSNPADALITMVYTLKQAYRQNAVWLMSRMRQMEARKFKEATTNAYIWQPGLQAGEPSQLLGHAVMDAEDMPAKAANSLSVAFGDFKAAYQIVDRRGIAVIRDIYTVKPFVIFNTTKRVGGDVVNFEAFKALKFAAS